jgi:predicted ATP-dependent serine protease
MAMAKMSYIWEGGLVRGGSSILGGKSFAGKSTFVTNRAIAVARGESFLDFGCQQTAVIYFALGSEAKPEAVRELMEIRRVTSLDPLFLYIDVSRRDLLDQLNWIVEEYEDPLIIMDTLHRATGIKDVNDYDEVADKLSPFTRFARQHNRVHLLVNHHAKKGEVFDIDAILGSSRLTSEVDNVLLYRSRPQDELRELTSFPRYGKRLDSLLVQQTDEDAKTLVAVGDAQEYREASVLGQVMRLLKKQPRLSTDSIYKIIGGNRQTLLVTLTHAADDGLLVRNKEARGFVYSIGLKQ